MSITHSVFIQSWMTPRLILLFESRGVKVKNRFCFVRALNERDLNTIEANFECQNTMGNYSFNFRLFSSLRKINVAEFFKLEILHMQILRVLSFSEYQWEIFKWPLVPNATFYPGIFCLTDWEAWNAEENWLVNIWLIAERDSVFLRDREWLTLNVSSLSVTIAYSALN